MDEEDPAFVRVKDKRRHGKMAGRKLVPPKRVRGLGHQIQDRFHVAALYAGETAMLVEQRDHFVSNHLSSGFAANAKEDARHPARYAWTVRIWLPLVLTLACARRSPSATEYGSLAAELLNPAGELVGQVAAAATSEGLALDARFMGLPPESTWILEFREGPTCGGPGFSAAGAPWGPTRPAALGPFVADLRGGAWVRSVAPDLTLKGPAGVFRRTVVVRAEGSESGIACGTFLSPPKAGPGQRTPSMTEMWEF
jgi:hypothetical protein